MADLIFASMLDLLVLSGIVLLGIQAGRLMAPTATRMEAAAVSFPLGAGALTFGVFLISWSGVPLRPMTVVGVWTALFGLVTAIQMVGRRAVKGLVDVSRSGNALAPMRPARRAIWIGLAAIAILTLAISVGRSHTRWDAAAVWAAKGYGIAGEGTVFAARQWGAHGLAYPLNIPLLISFFQLANHDLVPGSKMIFPLFFLSTLVGIGSFWRRLAVPDGWVAAGIGVVATVPAIFEHATYGYANIPFASYVVLGSLWGSIGVARRSAPHALVAGVLLAFATWTRPEGMLYVLAVLAILLGSPLLVRPSRPLAARLVGPVAVVGCLWFSFYLLYGISGSQTGGAMASAIEGWKVGEFRLEDLRLILGYFRRSMLHLSVWGLLFPLSFVLIGVRLRKLLDRSSPEIGLTALAMLSTSVVTAGLFYVGSYTVDGLFAWLTRSFPRAYFPSAILLAALALAVTAAGRGDQDGDPAGGADGPSASGGPAEPGILSPAG